MKDRLAVVIEKAGISKSEFSRKLGISAGNLGDWLKGRSEPTAKMVVRIYEEFKVNPAWLLLGEGEMHMLVSHNEGQAPEITFPIKKRSKQEVIDELSAKIKALEKELKDKRELLQMIKDIQ